MRHVSQPSEESRSRVPRRGAQQYTKESACRNYRRPVAGQVSLQTGSCLSRPEGRSLGKTLPTLHQRGRPPALEESPVQLGPSRPPPGRTDGLPAHKVLSPASAFLLSPRVSHSTLLF